MTRNWWSFDRILSWPDISEQIETKKPTLTENKEKVHLLNYLTLKASSHIGDTTPHDSMRHDPFFRSPYNQMDQFTHAARQCLVVTTKSCGTKNRSGSDFCSVCSDSIKKTAKENSFHRNLTWFSKFMTQKYSLKSQYLQLNITQVVVL